MSAIVPTVSASTVSASTVSASTEATSKQWVVYLLRCGDGSLYTGISNDLHRRLKQHSNGTASRYTRSRLPVELVYLEAQPDHSSALKREYAIKQFSRGQKEQLIRPPGTASLSGLPSEDRWVPNFAT